MNNADPKVSTAKKTRRHRRQAARRLAAPTIVTAAMAAGALVAGGAGQLEQTAFLAFVGQSGHPAPTSTPARPVIALTSMESSTSASHSTSLYVLGLIPPAPVDPVAAALPTTPGAVQLPPVPSRMLAVQSAQNAGLAALWHLLKHDPKHAPDGGATTAALARVVSPYSARRRYRPTTPSPT